MKSLLCCLGKHRYQTLKYHISDIGWLTTDEICVTCWNSKNTKGIPIGYEGPIPYTWEFGKDEEELNE